MLRRRTHRNLKSRSLPNGKKNIWEKSAQGMSAKKAVNGMVDRYFLVHDTKKMKIYLMTTKYTKLK
jgi:hypothetical protein